MEEGISQVALSRRGKALLSTFLALVVVGGGVIGYLMFTGQVDAIPFLGGTRTPTTCPLTGVEPRREGQVERTAVAVKVENISSSRPQAGLNRADVVYEEPVEGGITRFIALYHCTGAQRVGPVRSARFADPRILVQLGTVIFAYSGGIQEVKDQIAATGSIHDVNYDAFPEVYQLDPNKVAPHNIYTSTADVRDAASVGREPPQQIFEFDEEPPSREESGRGRSVHLELSEVTEVDWAYRRGSGRYVRAHGAEPHTAEDGERVSATNVVVMEVRMRNTGIVDAAGNPSPEPIVVGSGRAFVFRGGRVIEGEWRRESVDEVTQLLDPDGEVIPLAPGRTWIELVPRKGTITF